MPNQTAQKWILASRNAGKLAEFQNLFSKHPNTQNIQVFNQNDFFPEDIPETGLTFIENALIKARYCAAKTGLPALADDSGLCVDALGGAPGLYSARYAGTPTDNAKNNLKLLADLQKIAQNPENSIFHAHYYCVLVWLRHADDPAPIIGIGAWQGQILAEPRGQNGFGYDPLFFCPESKQTAAEMSLQNKQQISHRARAFRHLLSQF